MNNESRILFARRDVKCFIKIVGEGTFQNAGSLKTLYQQMQTEGVTDFVIDLEECTLLDSTTLGVILGLGLKIRERGTGKLSLSKPNPEIATFIKNLGLDRLGDISGD